MEPIGLEHASRTPGVKPSTVVGLPDEVAVAVVVALPDVVAVADVVGLRDEVGVTDGAAVADVVGLPAATQPRKAMPAASVAASISTDRDFDRQ